MNDNTSLPEKDLPPGRHRHLKEHLMREIRHTPAADEDRKAARRRKWLRPAVAGPALAGALALAVVAGFAVTGSDGSAAPVGRDGRATYAFAPRVNGDTTGGAAKLLDRIATVAARSPAGGTVRDDQFVYVRSRVAAATVGEGVDTKLAALHGREVWMSVDGTRPGLLREPGGGLDNEELERDPAPGRPGYEVSTSYRHLQTLPTTTDAMLKWLRSQGESGDSDKNGDQDAFVLAGELLRESLMPPETSAALFRAVARISGVMVVPDAVNAAGRHGVAVARYDAYNDGVRDELVFDRKTLELIGSRSVATKAKDGIEAGQVLSTSAVLERAVVDAKGRRP
ncbi:CU044_5270 family protein [Streptomyces sp. NPDC058382]|uniref:CU044_5270 family protein n=1 Tax=unclassified Streptomyces TaxID=2593676 RepID=UPI00363431F1